MFSPNTRTLLGSSEESEVGDGPRAYKMNHPSRGTALIFNHYEFWQDLRTREGTQHDLQALKAIFDKLRFNVDVRQDNTCEEIETVLRAESKKDHTNSDCLVVVVMTHGVQNKLCAKDKEYSTDTLWKYFDAKNCPTLAGKPKLFFIEACRGSSLNYSHTVPCDTLDAREVSKTYSIPTLSDILIMHSTIEGKVAYILPDSGSLFIQSLVKQLEKYYKTNNLLTILTMVNYQVAINSNIPGSPELKQMPSIVSMLTRFLYFNREYVASPSPGPSSESGNYEATTTTTSSGKRKRVEKEPEII